MRNKIVPKLGVVRVYEENFKLAMNSTCRFSCLDQTFSGNVYKGCPMDYFKFAGGFFLFCYF